MSTTQHAITVTLGGFSVKALQESGTVNEHLVALEKDGESGIKEFLIPASDGKSYETNNQQIGETNE